MCPANKPYRFRPRTVACENSVGTGCLSSYWSTYSFIRWCNSTSSCILINRYPGIVALPRERRLDEKHMKKVGSFHYPQRLNTIVSAELFKLPDGPVEAPVVPVDAMPMDVKTDLREMWERSLIVDNAEICDGPLHSQYILSRLRAPNSTFCFFPHSKNRIVLLGEDRPRKAIL
ncbi:uncharacterized protein LOC129748978 [Uranotaenia lowii]|uniref:uncharacterized protein LOC129748978 n=1 Tax=Uranotaenia lowii TaxID=190385 RepID=UPI002478333B|nr:uncharacterized protein LOC129748978 [Uranotaenia lowii]